LKLGATPNRKLMYSVWRLDLAYSSAWVGKMH